jgi:hypothetical protein
MSNLKVCGCSDVNCTHVVMKTPNGWLHVASVDAGIDRIGTNVQKDLAA